MSNTARHKGEVIGTHQDHGIAYLPDKDGIPGNAAAHVQLIGGILLLQLGSPGGGQALVDICAGGLLNLPDREEKRVLGEFRGHRMRTTGSLFADGMNRASSGETFASLACKGKKKGSVAANSANPTRSATGV
jgi:hypothetical protein